MMKNIIEQTESFIRKYGMIEKDDVVIAGVSGGADSVCLLFILCALRNKIGFQVMACHVNHGIRGAEADADEAFVKELCRQLDVPSRFFHKNVELIARKRKQSSEEAGRAVRREAFETMCREDGGTKIATAHHRDDNAETVLLNIARGTGLKGLCGIHPVRGKWIRPLLALGREQIEDWLREQKITWCTDATNAEDIYTRNRIRHNILPALREQVNEGTVRHLEELSVQAQEVWEYLEQGTKQAWERCVSLPRTGEHKNEGQGSSTPVYGEAYGGLLIGREAFRHEMPAVQKQLLKVCLASVRGGEKDIGTVHLNALAELFDRQCGKELDLPGGVTAGRVYEGVVLRKQAGEGRKISGNISSAAEKTKSRRETDGKSEEVRLNIPGVSSLPDGIHKVICRFVDAADADKAKESPQKSYTKWFDYDIIKCSLSARTRQSGDYLVVDEKGSRQKLKSWFINEKIPRENRDKMLLIADGQHIVWIPGHRMSRACQISNRTEKILEIKITEDKKNVREDQSAGSGREG